MELKPDGASCAVTNSNVDEYIQLQMRYRLLDRVKDQVKALLLGFYDVIPEALLSVFDFQELELLLCGLPEIDIQDWKRNTEYTGDYERKGASHKVVKWFWEVVVDDFDEEHKARLLQFVTGTSGAFTMCPQDCKHFQQNDRCLLRASGLCKVMITTFANLQSIQFQKQYQCFPKPIHVSTV